MAEGKKHEKTEEKQYLGEEKLGKMMDKAHAQLAEDMEGRPYLLIMASGYEIGKEGELSKLAAQWSWRSNLFTNKENGKKIMEFLLDQLEDVENHPEGGIRKKYGIEKGETAKD